VAASESLRDDVPQKLKQCRHCLQTKQFVMLDAGTNMSDDPPPPYTAVDQSKISELTAQLPTAPVNFNSANSGQPLPPLLLPAYPSVTPGYRTVIYYPAPNPADAAVLLQPQPQVITVQQQQPVQSNAEEAGLSSTTSTDICLMCCFCMCCCCPCVLVSFM